jgi:GT2 family glycosyltransferase
MRFASKRGSSDLGLNLSTWHIPGFLKELMPQAAIEGLQRLKGTILTRDLPRDIVFEQSPEDALASASISIIVPIHDAPMVTRRCLASLEKYASQSEVILVDDASNLPETAEIIQSFSTRNGWKVVREKKSVGHSKACAAALLATRPFLCLLNSDTVVTPRCWRQAKDVLDNDYKIGIAGPSTSHSGTSQTLPVAAEVRAYWTDNQICAFAEQLLSERLAPVVMDLPWVSGFGLFIRRDLWEEVGGFDEKLPDYGNEVDLCRRVIAKGYRVVWIRNSYIHHFGQQSYRDTIGKAEINSRIQAAETYNTRKILTPPNTSEVTRDSR